MLLFCLCGALCFLIGVYGAVFVFQRHVPFSHNKDLFNVLLSSVCWCFLVDFASMFIIDIGL